MAIPTSGPSVSPRTNDIVANCSFSKKLAINPATQIPNAVQTIKGEPKRRQTRIANTNTITYRIQNPDVVSGKGRSARHMGSPPVCEASTL